MLDSTQGWVSKGGNGWVTLDLGVTHTVSGVVMQARQGGKQCVLLLGFRTRITAWYADRV